VKFRFVQEYRETFRVGRMCEVLKVSRSGFYAWCKRQPSQREASNQKLAERIREVHASAHGIYGAPRVHRELREAGESCGRHRVARIMRAEGIVGRSKRRFRRAQTRRSERPAAPDLLQRVFVASKPNQIWVGDITRVRTGEGPLYLAALLDLFSRKVVGWATAQHARYQIAAEALQMALVQRRPGSGLLHHSDRGAQYTAFEYQSHLNEEGLTCSMSRPGNCLDNAVAESFLHTLKTEWIYHYRYATRAEARASSFEYIECFYNRIRKHSTLDYRSPEEYEREQSAAQPRVHFTGARSVSCNRLLDGQLEQRE
jgi:transposase InsO family protein